MRRSVSVVFVVVAVLSAFPMAAQQFPPPLHPPFTVASLWPQLMEGNALYVNDALPYTQLDDARKATENKQEPPVTVLACSDSRVPPELVFGRGIGDLFVVRAAGSVADTFGIASIEYGIVHHWTKVIVVLAHERCGAVSEALKKTDPGTPSLLALVQRIRKSFTGVDLGKHHDAVRPAVIANAKASADYLVAHSKVIRDAVRKKEVQIVVAYYGFSEGKVERVR